MLPVLLRATAACSFAYSHSQCNLSLGSRVWPFRRSPTSRVAGWVCGWFLLMASAVGQPPGELIRGDPVPREVREIYDRGISYLVRSQGPDGNWPDGYAGPGTTGLALMVFLASGEDPNYGKYREPIRLAMRAIIEAQDPVTGYLGDSMYQHGFATLALAEAYGAVDETDGRSERSDDRISRPSIAQALELAVRCAVTSQGKNPHQAWRYSPSARDADTSVSGSVLMGLLAARNAGIAVPDKSIDAAVDYFVSMTGDNGAVGYSGGLGGFGQSIARSSIACLVFSIAQRKDLPQYSATRHYVISNMNEESHYVEYARYYQAQALFQADVAAWERWNRRLVRQLKALQNADGSFSGQFGNATSTSLNLLALAVNYRFLPVYER
ncbi:MAG: squalene--hopene cyclase [Pirellulaceae bacterium]|nr:MAG: squalene--hopene cyclase [Pirellulaceae bacterium]